MDDQDLLIKNLMFRNILKISQRRSIAQLILKRTTTLGELVSQLESIAEVIETQDLLLMKRKEIKNFLIRL